MRPGDRSEIDRPNLDAAPLQLRLAFVPGIARGHEENVAVRFRSIGEFGQICRQLSIVARIDSSERLGSDQTGFLAHDVERKGHMRAGRDLETPCFRVQLQQNARGGKHDDVGPGLVDLLDNVERPVMVIASGETISWSNGRQRGGPSIGMG